MTEVAEVHARSNAVETLFIVDSMAGQDAVNAAKAFDERLPLTGVILTKADGDAKGGVALSVREITGKPIRFLGVGEKIDPLDVFRPERMASRILGMGDVLTLVEEIEEKVEKDKAQKLARKLKKGRGFDLSDLKDQLEQMMNMGGMAAMLEKLPLPGVEGRRERAAVAPPGRHHQLHDARGKTLPEDHQRFPQEANCLRLRSANPGRKPASQAVHADGAYDAKSVPRRHEKRAARHARRAASTRNALSHGNLKDYSSRKRFTFELKPVQCAT